MVCDKEGCGKHHKTHCKGINGKAYCSISHLKEETELTEEAKLMRKRHIANYNPINSAINSAKGNAKSSAALLATKQAITARHIADGANIDVGLTLDAVQSIAQDLVRQTLTIVGDNHYYLAAGREHGIKDEVFAFSSLRGNGKPLVHGPNNERITAGMLRDDHGWRSERLNFRTNNAENCDMVEHCCHEIMHAHRKSIWLTPGAGSVHHGKDGTIYTFTLAIAFGPGERIEFRANHPRKLPGAPRFASAAQLVVSEQDTRPIASLPLIPAIEQVTKPEHPFILEDDDVDDDYDTKPSAMKLATEPHALRPPPLNVRSHDNFIMSPLKHQRTLELGQSTAPGSKPTKAKAQQGLWGRTAGPQPPKKPKASATFGLMSKPKKK